MSATRSLAVYGDEDGVAGPQRAIQSSKQLANVSGSKRVALLLEHSSRLEDDREPWRIVYPLSEVLLLLTEPDRAHLQYAHLAREPKDIHE